jgi:uncharacterized membrane protein
MLLLFSARELREVRAKTICYAFGLSLYLLLILGLGINLGLPALGIERPLAIGPLIVSISVLVGLLAVVAAVRYDNDKIGVTIPEVRSPVPIAFATLPFLTIIGINILGRTGQNWLLLICLLLVAIGPLAIVMTKSSEWHGFAVWTMSLSVLYHDALAPGKTFPGSPYVVRIWKAARWEPGTNSGGQLATELLQHGTIFPVFANLSDLNIMTQMLVVNPLLVSFIPVVLFVAFRNYIRSEWALLGASIFMFAHPFFNQYTTAGRSATPVIFLALFALALSDSDSSPMVRSVLLLVFLNGVVFTHYGTSYFVMVALCGSLGVMLVLRLIDQRMELSRLSLPRGLEAGVPSTVTERAGLSWSLVFFYVAITFSWYLYTNAQRAFALFPRHLADSINQLLIGSAGPDAGRTAARLQRDYGSPAITYSKTIYVIIAMLIFVGLAVTLARRFFRPDDYTLDDSFFALGGTMLGIFGLTLIVRTWGGGRPMMITFVFSLLFAVVGMAWAGEHLERFFESRYTRDAFPRITQKHVAGGFALFVGMLFIINSGFASALFLPGIAPSNVPLSDGETNLETDVQTHAWLIDHRATGNVYGDHIAFTHTDHLAPAIAARTEDGIQYGPERPRGDVSTLQESGKGPGYLLILGHNAESGEFDLYLETAPLEFVDERYTRDKIYTTGQSWIYSFDEDD